MRRAVAPPATPDGTGARAFSEFGACRPNAYCSVDSSCSTDLIPCGGDGLIDLDDIVAVLDAFQGAYACSCP